MKEQEFKAA